MSEDVAAKFGVTDPDMARRMNASATEDDGPPIRTLREYLQLDLESEVTEIVAPRMAVRGGITVTVADGGTGKTSLALNRILNWAAGLAPWDIYPYTPIEPLKTLVIENEGAGSLFQEKIRTMLDNPPTEEFADTREAVMDNVIVWGDGGYAGVHLDEPHWVTQVYRGIEECRPDIVFMEPFARLWTGDENSNTEVNAFISSLEEMAAKFDVAVYLCHHKTKGWPDDPLELQYKSRGASALADASTYFELIRPSAGGGEREVDCTKNRFADRPGPYRLRWREDNSGWYDLVSDDEKHAKIVTAIDDGAETLEEIAERLGDKRGSERHDRTRQWINQAMDQGLIRQVRHAGEVRYRTGAVDDSERPTL